MKKTIYLLTLTMTSSRLCGMFSHTIHQVQKANDDAKTTKGASKEDCKESESKDKNQSK